MTTACPCSKAEAGTVQPDNFGRAEQGRATVRKRKGITGKSEQTKSIREKRGARRTENY